MKEVVYTVFVVELHEICYFRRLTSIFWIWKWKWKSLSCLTLCDPINHTVHGLLQAIILEWVAFHFRGFSQSRNWMQVYPGCKRILYQLSHEGSPRIMEWVAYPFSSRSSRLRNQIRVSCIAGGFFTSWAILCAVKNVFNSDRSLWAIFLYWRLEDCHCILYCLA